MQGSSVCVLTLLQSHFPSCCAATRSCTSSTSRQLAHTPVQGVGSPEQKPYESKVREPDQPLAQWQIVPSCSRQQVPHPGSFGCLQPCNAAASIGTGGGSESSSLPHATQPINKLVTKSFTGRNLSWQKSLSKGAPRHYLMSRGAAVDLVSVLQPGGSNAAVSRTEAWLEPAPIDQQAVGPIAGASRKEVRRCPQRYEQPRIDDSSREGSPQLELRGPCRCGPAPRLSRLRFSPRHAAGSSHVARIVVRRVACSIARGEAT